MMRNILFLTLLAASPAMAVDAQAQTVDEGGAGQDAPFGSRHELGRPWLSSCLLKPG